ncbi:MAG: anaerobic ribonucleoside-triphosphate reductase activating protein [Eggerthellaceae bacterium]|nr:anaerobic ribonucleoside-triphosphate reductase activating protein [Eggerthellaceae bacterium]
MDKTMNINLYGAVPDSIVDGPGLRYAVFVQGCSHACPGCHNPESQPHEGGTLTTVDAVLADIRANGLVHDVTLTGGEPFEQAAACAELARALKAEGYGIWAYTGGLYEDLACCAEQGDRDVQDLLDHIDVLVDGPFVQERKSLALKWCGSSNQRLIDMAATRAAGHVVEWQPPSFVPQKPASW